MTTNRFGGDRARRVGGAAKPAGTQDPDIAALNAADKRPSLYGDTGQPVLAAEFVLDLARRPWACL